MNPATIVAGTITSGNASDMLQGPRGIFVATDLDLYVADSNNDRIQQFPHGKLNGTTIAGRESLSMTINRKRPTAVVLDADGYLFIVDRNNHRIVRSDVLAVIHLPINYNFL